MQRSSIKDFVAVVDEEPLRFFTQYTLPSEDWLSTAVPLDEDATNQLEHLRDALKACTEWSESQMLGWPNPVQGDDLSDTQHITLLQLDAIVDLGAWITDGLRYWMLDRDSLAQRDYSEIWTEHQYT